MNLSTSTVDYIRSHLPSMEWTGSVYKLTSVWTGPVYGLTLLLIFTARLAKRFPHQKWAPCKVRGLFVHMRTAWPTQSQSTKVYLELRPEMAMLSIRWSSLFTGPVHQSTPLMVDGFVCSIQWKLKDSFLQECFQLSSWIKSVVSWNQMSAYSE